MDRHLLAHVPQLLLEMPHTVLGTVQIIHRLIQTAVLNMRRDHAAAKHIISTPVFSRPQLVNGAVQIMSDRTPRPQRFFQFLVLYA
ncbi:hypothetical protein D3C77_556480 [compost metagenome]